MWVSKYKLKDMLKRLYYVIRAGFILCLMLTIVIPLISYILFGVEIYWWIEQIEVGFDENKEKNDENKF